MRDDTSFSDRKLSEKEFSDKYWMKGKFKYQYHTAGIEDARDEREQFVFTKISKYTRLVVAIFLLVISLILLGLRKEKSKP